MTPVGFTQPGPTQSWRPLWIVIFLDRHAEEPDRQIAGVFTSEGEAMSLLVSLQQKTGAESYDYEVERIKVYNRRADWRPDQTNYPYRTVPGLKQAKVSLPSFKGHQCLSVNRILLQRPGHAPETRGLEIGWRTGARVQLGVETTGTILITPQHWRPPSERPVDPDSTDVPMLRDRWRSAKSLAGETPPSRSPLGSRVPDKAVLNGKWSSEPVGADDELSLLPGRRVHAFSVTENEDGSIGAIRVRFTGVTLVASARGDSFFVDVSEGPNAP